MKNEIMEKIEKFNMAEEKGNVEIRKAFNSTFREWKDNYEYLTELVLILNRKIWQWWTISKKYHETAMDISHLCAVNRVKLYYELREQADSYACDNLTGEELSYFRSKTADTDGIRGLSFDQLMGYLRLLEDITWDIFD